jgi:cytochrome d ubiquinol oxidase subunit II
MELTLIAFAVVAFSVVMYVVLDGFDLGVGILFPFAADRGERDLMMASVAPLWDGNETWLVLGGATLLAAFPAAYATLLPALYPPLMLFLFALVFRGIAFEVRPKARRVWAWDLAFSGGSMLAAFAQGVMVGAVVQGFAEGPLRPTLAWLTPFSLFTGIALVAGYALLGATWLVLKTEGRLQAWARRSARRLAAGLLLCIGVVSAWTALAVPAVAERWFGWPQFTYLAPVPLLTAALAVGLWRALARDRELAPFVYAVGLFLLAYAGLAVSIWPYLVPRRLTLWQAAAPPETQAFVLVGVAVMLPLVLGYTVHTYRVFRGKVRPGEGGY